MLLQTNSYIVPKDKRAQHARLVQRFRQTLTRLGCDHFEAYEQVGANWSPADTTGRFVQLMRFRDRKQQLSVQAAERNDATAQALIKEFCELINFPYQQQQGLFAVGFYHSLLPNQAPRSAAQGDQQEDDADLETDEVEDEPFTADEAAPEPGHPASGQSTGGNAGPNAPIRVNARPARPLQPNAAEPEEMSIEDLLDQLPPGTEESLLDQEIDGEQDKASECENDEAPREKTDADDEIELKGERRK